MDAITRYLGVGSYAQWDESTRQTWLLTELQGKRPMLPRVDSLAEVGFDEIVQVTRRSATSDAKVCSQVYRFAIEVEVGGSGSGSGLGSGSGSGSGSGPGPGDRKEQRAILRISQIYDVWAEPIASFRLS